MSCRTKGVDAPGPRGATTENIVQYLRKEQRSGTGCSDGRLQRDFGDATLDMLTGPPGSEELTFGATVTRSHCHVVVAWGSRDHQPCYLPSARQVRSGHYIENHASGR